MGRKLALSEIPTYNNGIRGIPTLPPKPPKGTMGEVLRGKHRCDWCEKKDWGNWFKPIMGETPINKGAKKLWACSECCPKVRKHYACWNVERFA